MSDMMKIEEKYFNEIEDIITKYKETDEYKNNITYANSTRIHAASNLSNRLPDNEGILSVPKDEIKGLVEIIEIFDSSEDNELLNYLESLI